MREILIKKLKIVINGLETDNIHYDWDHQGSCNCGVVAQVMLEIPAANLEKRFSNLCTKGDLASFFGDPLGKTATTWKNLASMYCPITGIPTKELFKELYEAGMTRDDFNHLEYLSNPFILKRAEVDTTKPLFGEGLFSFIRISDGKYYTRKENLIKYLKAWVSILEEELVPEESLDELRKAELHAVSDNNFERAAEIRDRIAEMAK